MKKENLPDWNDGLALVGLVILSIGIWLISPPISLITIGTIVLGISLARSRSQ